MGIPAPRGGKRDPKRHKVTLGKAGAGGKRGPAFQLPPELSRASQEQEKLSFNAAPELRWEEIIWDKSQPRCPRCGSAGEAAAPKPSGMS